MSSLIYSIYLFSKYIPSVRMAILDMAATAVSNTESPALVRLIFY